MHGCFQKRLEFNLQESLFEAQNKRLVLVKLICGQSWITNYIQLQIFSNFSIVIKLQLVCA